MNTNKIIYSLLASMLLFCSCSFEDRGCIIRGTLIAYPQPASSVPEKGNLLYYPHPNVPVQTIYGSADVFVTDTLKKELASGKYDLLYYQRGVNKVEETAIGAKSVTLVAPTINKGSKVYHAHEQSFITSSLKESFRVPDDADVLCPFPTRPLVQLLRFFVHLKGSPHHVDMMEAHLYGVCTSKKVATYEKGADHAIQSFLLKRDGESLRRKDIYVLGINHALANTLYLYTQFDGNQNSVHEIDLSDVLKQLTDTTDVLDIHLEVDLDRYFGIDGADGGVTITAWETHQFPALNLAPH